MPAYVYANGQYHALAGNKIAKDGALLTMADTDRIVVNGVAYPLGAATGASQQQSASGSFFHATTEPSTGNVLYVTPLGAGLKDGSSWANAAPGQDIHLLLLQCSSGDRIYFAEGDYTTDRVMSLPTGVSLYGGFRAADSYAWSGRNSFTNPTRFTMAAATAFPWATCASCVSGQAVDGFAVEGYDGTAVGNAALPVRNLYASSGRVEVRGGLEHACLEGLAANVTLSGVSDSVFFGLDGCIAVGSAQRCTFVNCHAGYDADITIRSGSGVESGGYAVLKSTSAISSCDFIGCIAVAPSGDMFSYILWGLSHGIDMRFVNCLATTAIAGCNSLSGCHNICFVNCQATSLFRLLSYYNTSYSKFFTAVNCVAREAFNTSCVISSVAWNCSGIAYSYNPTGSALYTQVQQCAQSDYDAANAVTLGYDNSIARFTNTGFAPARGVQDAGPCPNPISDPIGYAAWMAAFGDWHPLANSFLVGAGGADPNVTDDLDGVARPDPPTIGCYEPVPQNANS